MIARKLHELNPAEFPEIEIAGKFVSDDSFYAERDIAKLLNIWPHYKNGRNSHYHAVFRKTRRPLALLVMGDSFMGQLLANMNLSGYTTYENSFHFENRLPTRDEFRTALRAARACIIVGNVQKFITPFWEGYVAALNGYFSGPASLRHGRQP